ncbi:MAG: ABC transporter permease, partial [Chloroflexi bacterium]|nr:ABC transporter permease [Chloroflexota bacterium]
MILLVLMLLGWQAITQAKLIHKIILPPPAAVWEALPDLLFDSDFPMHIGTTLVEILLGFALGSLLGLAMGLSMAVSPLLRKAFLPMTVAFQATPRVILAPLVIAWFGFGIESKVVQAVILSFFPVLINTLVGLLLTEENAIKLMQSLGATRWQTLRMLRFPDALPTIFAGVKTALTFSMIGAIISEFIGAEAGLGFLLAKYNYELRIPEVYVLILILSILGIALFVAI